MDDSGSCKGPPSTKVFGLYLVYISIYVANWVIIYYLITTLYVRTRIIIWDNVWCQNTTTNSTFFAKERVKFKLVPFFLGWNSVQEEFFLSDYGSELWTSFVRMMSQDLLKRLLLILIVRSKSSSSHRLTIWRMMNYYVASPLIRLCFRNIPRYTTEIVWGIRVIDLRPYIAWLTCLSLKTLFSKY